LQKLGAQSGAETVITLETTDHSRSAEPLLVTVITPTYNQARYIAACIESVLGQTHRNIEYLIFDACSNDGTDTIVTRYLSDPRLRYVRERDNGQASAINKGFAQGRGDIVCWLNSDDFFYDNQVLDKVCRIFASRPDVDIVTGDGYLAAEDGSLVSPLVAADPATLSAKGMATSYYIMQPATFWRRSDLRLDESFTFAFDWKFFAVMFRERRPAHYLHDYLAVYRPHEASKTTQDSARRKYEGWQVLKLAGASPLQSIWSHFIYALYELSEKSRLPLLKRGAHFINRVMRVMSGGRIFST
jgi:glycosyltransferase involved in cell wall biosynthesis